MAQNTSGAKGSVKNPYKEIFADFIDKEENLPEKILMVLKRAGLSACQNSSLEGFVEPKWIVYILAQYDYVSIENVSNLLGVRGEHAEVYARAVSMSVERLKYLEWRMGSEWLGLK